MSRQTFVPWSPRGHAAEMIERANTICAQYQAQGLDLTLRQLYYRFVALDLFPADRKFIRLASGRWVRDVENGSNNAEPNYKWLGGLVDQARLGGLLDWSYIVDRTRQTYGTDGADTSPGDAIESTAVGYRRELWATQPLYVEVWVEKEALAGIISRAARRLRVPYFACRGYASQSSMYRAGQRFKWAGRDGKPGHVIHLGDHDPSGIDMSRDIGDRLAMFCGRHAPTIHRIALNMDQVEEYDPPPNPARESDSRFAGYLDVYGDESWELDALDPVVLDALITEQVRALRDEDAWREALRQERVERAQMRLVADQWDDVIELVGTPDVDADEDPAEDPDDD